MPFLSREERETIIRYDYYDNTIHVYSTERGWWSFCEKAGMELADEQRNRGNVVSRQYLGPMKVSTPGVRLRSALGLLLGGGNRGRKSSVQETGED